MSSKNTSSAPKLNAGGGTVSINGTPVANTSYNKNTKSYTSNANFLPGDQGIFDTSQQGFASLLPKIFSAADTSPEAIQGYANTLAQPQLDKLKTEAGRAQSQAAGAFNNRGMLDSTFFGDYSKQAIQEPYLQGVKDINNEAQIQAYQLPNLKMQPLLTAADAARAGQDDTFQRLVTLLNGANSNVGLSNSYLGNQYNAQAAQKQQKSGLFGSFL